ncbi:hypothetical protein [Clostridium sp.]
MKTLDGGRIGVAAQGLGLSGSATKIFKSWTEEITGMGEVVDLPYKEAAS